MNVAALIADDELPARERMLDLLADYEWVTCVGQTGDGVSTRRAIDTLQPDVVFLDVHMPGCSGLDVASAVGVGGSVRTIGEVEALRRPHIVFVSAYDRYAVEAFRLDALDYLLKPVEAARLRMALDRLMEALATSRHRARDGAIAAAPIARVFVRRFGTIIPIPVDAIVRIESRRDYVAMFTVDERHILHLTMKALQQRLDPTRFVQIHRRHIVNLDHVTAFRAFDSSRLAVCLKDGSTVVASRARSQELRKLSH